MGKSLQWTRPINKAKFDRILADKHCVLMEEDKGHFRVLSSFRQSQALRAIKNQATSHVSYPKAVKLGDFIYTFELKKESTTNHLIVKKNVTEKVIKTTYTEIYNRIKVKPQEVFVEDQQYHNYNRSKYNL